MKLNSIFSLLTVIVFLPSCENNSNENITKNNYTGKWYWESKDKKSTFFISLHAKKDSIYGFYCSSYNIGNRIDCGSDTEEINIAGKIHHENIQLTFNSFFDAKDGNAVIKYNKHDATLTWSITKPPKGGSYYAPQSATLTRKKLW